MNKQLPNLLIVGAAKSGTTSLHHYLNQHSEVFMSKHKEPHFLINNEIGKDRIPNGISDFEKYKALFNKGENHRYRGESSVMYLQFPEIVIPNIKKFLGEEVKIIIMLRNPVKRAYSGYQHVKRYNVMETLSFSEAIRITEKRYESTLNMTPASRYLELGNYYNQLKFFLESFDRIHIIIYDDYKKNFSDEIAKVFEFLDIPNIKIDKKQKYMVGGWQWKSEWIKRVMVENHFLKRIFKFVIPSIVIRKHIRSKLQESTTKRVEKISSTMENFLKSYYKEDVYKLSKLLNRDLTHWVK